MKRLILLILAPLGLLAQVPMAYTPYQVLDARTGVAIACSGCFIYTYMAGTTTPITTYTNSTLMTANTNPVLTNSAGYAVDGSTITGIWGVSGTCYKLVVQDASSVTIYTQDNLCLPPGTNSFAAPVTISGSSGTVLAITATSTAVGLTVSGPAAFTGTNSTSALTLANASGPALTVSNGAIFNSTAVFNGAVTLNSTCTGCWPGGTVAATGNLLMGTAGAGAGPYPISSVNGTNSYTVNQTSGKLTVSTNSGTDYSLAITQNGIGPGVVINTNTSSSSLAAIESINTGSGYGEYSIVSSVGPVAGFVNGNGTCTISPTTTSLSCSSDSRLKENVLNLYNPLAVIEGLRPVMFSWRKDKRHERHPGFIAQEVQQVAPQLVQVGDDGYLTLNETGIIPYLVGVVKEQQGEIKALGFGLVLLFLWSGALTYKVFFS